MSVSLSRMSVLQASLKVIWNSENPQPVPGWVVALAVLAGLLLLALLIFVMHKVNSCKL